MAKNWISVIFAISLLCGCLGLPEQGIFDLQFDKKVDLGYITKIMFNNTDIGVKIECTPNKKSTEDVYVEVRWLLYWTKCIEEFTSEENIKTIINNEFQFVGYDNKTHKLFISDWETHKCDGDIHLGDKSDDMPFYYDFFDDDDYGYDYDYTTTAFEDDDADEAQDDTESDQSKNEPAEPTDKPGSEIDKPPANPTQANVAPKSTTNAPKTRKKRAETKEKAKESKNKEKGGKKAAAKKMKPGMPQDVQIVTHSNHDGPHLFAIYMSVSKENSYEAKVTIYTKAPRGYLSAIEWPLLPFYGVMSCVYLVYGLAWLVMMFMNWRDLLRLQFWIGGVILIGMIEKAVFFGEFESVNKTGRSLFGALILAEMVSAMKRALARVLVIIVSLGFGIVKPRLGPVLHKVVAVGTLYFVLGSIEGILRVVKERNGKEAMLASIPLAVIDAAICWWVFTSLVQVMRTLRLRRNIVKLSLYRHFTNTLIFAVLASIVYMIWSIKQHRLVTCMTDWREIWVDDAFWHILFCIILGVIIVLWRPSANNQRFAFSPLLDGANDEEVPEDEEKLITDAYDGMKKRNEKAKVIPYRDNETDKDLQWIDENIPASVADTALPSLLDSDEEEVNTKYEMSKMD